MNKLKVSVMSAAMVLCMGVVAMPQQVEAQPTIEETVAWLNSYMPKVDGTSGVIVGVKFDKGSNNLIFELMRQRRIELQVGLIRYIKAEDMGDYENYTKDSYHIICKYPADPDGIHQRCSITGAYRKVPVEKIIKAIKNIQSQVPRLVWKKQLF